jgi:hypothetical protein
MKRVYVNWFYHGQESEPNALIIHEHLVDSILAESDKWLKLTEGNLIRVVYRLDYPVRAAVIPLELVEGFIDEELLDDLLALESGEYMTVPEELLEDLTRSPFYSEDLVMFVADEFGVSVIWGDNPYREFPILTRRLEYGDLPVQVP